nr:glycosyltransferase [candidate division Zixibacteria bacterium]
MIRVLHVDTGRVFRGGQRQVNLLIHTLARYDLEQYLACPEGSPLAAAASKAVVKLFPLSKSNFMRFLERREIRHFIEDNRINLVHAHDSHAHTLITIIKAKPAPALVVTRRSSARIGLGSRTKYLAHNIRYIAISKHIRGLLVDGGVPENMVTVISSMIDFESFRKNAVEMGKYEAYREESRKVIISGGAFDHEKGFFDAVRAIQRLSQKRKDFVYYLYGEGTEEKKMREYIRLNNLTEIIRMPGWQKTPAEYLQGGTVFISPSYEEGLNMSIVDAMAAGVPVVVTNIEPHAENVIDHKSGLLFNPGDINGMATAAGKILDDSNLASGLISEGLKVAERHDCRRVAGRIYDLYCELVACRD